MAHQLNVQGAKFVRVVWRDKAKYALVQDPQSPNLEILMPTDQRYYAGLRLNFEGQIVDSGLKFVRVQPYCVSFYED